jgi:nitrate reductase gamma subunit
MRLMSDVSNLFKIAMLCMVLGFVIGLVLGLNV